MSEAYEKRKNDKKNELKEWIVSIAIVIVVAFVVRTFVFSTAVVKGISMEPNYYHGNVLVVNKFIYDFSQPKLGDVIICDYNDVDGEKLIKRVIGTPGDTIDFLPNNEGKLDVSINGEIIEEDYTKEGTGFYGDEEYPFTVPDNCYFVMGDNRDNSTDSRWQDIGAINKKNIVGKAAFKIWPLGK